MRVFVDQSGKVEDTKKLTVVAFANGKAKTLLINAVEKRKLIKIMRRKPDLNIKAEAVLTLFSKQKAGDPRRG